MTDISPTPEQSEQCVLVQNEVLENANRLLREGIDARIVLAGIGAATASLISSAWGPRMTPQWFAQQAILSRELADKGH